MGKKDKRIDAYIEKSQDFAKPILREIREIVHKACPDVEETMKWSFPHFDYKGEMMCSMAAFKQHCAFGFWKASLMKGKKTFSDKNKDAMGHLGKITGMSDLPSEKDMISDIKEAMKLNEIGVKISKKPAAPKKEPEMPKEFRALLNKKKKALKTFEEFSPSHKREYLEWILEAKTDTTKNKRMLTAIEWLEEGKSRNWKYK